MDARAQTRGTNAKQQQPPPKKRASAIVIGSALGVTSVTTRASRAAPRARLPHLAIAPMQTQPSPVDAAPVASTTSSGAAAHAISQSRITRANGRRTAMDDVRVGGAPEDAAVAPRDIGRVPNASAVSEPAKHERKRAAALVQDDECAGRDTRAEHQPAKKRNVEEQNPALSKAMHAALDSLSASHLIPSEKPATAAVVKKGEWTVERKREAFARIREFLWTRLDIGLDDERRGLARYLEAPHSTQGLLVTGSSSRSTTTIIKALLKTLGATTGIRREGDPPARYECFHVNGELASTPKELYGNIRSRLRGNWKLPQWREVDACLSGREVLPVAYTTLTNVLVIEAIDWLIKDADRAQAPLGRLLGFLNRLVAFRGLKLLVIGHEPKTVCRFSTQFGRFTALDVENYVLRLPRYTFVTLTEHLEAVAKAALAPMGDDVTLNDVLVPKAIQWAAQKATKYKQCELDSVVSVLRSAFIKMLNQCRHDKADVETDMAKWRLGYGHVTAAATTLFQDDMVHRIQCVGVIPQSVLLVLIDAGPCTEEELLQHVYDRHHVHVWILLIVYFKRDKFDGALDLLLSVPVVKTREVTVLRRGRWRSEVQYYALPTRQHLIDAAGKKELIKLIL